MVENFCACRAWFPKGPGGYGLSRGQPDLLRRPARQIPEQARVAELRAAAMNHALARHANRACQHPHGAKFRVRQFSPVGRARGLMVNSN